MRGWDEYAKLQNKHTSRLLKKSAEGALVFMFIP